MLHYIKGKFSMTFPGGVVIETGGLGYEIHMPENSSVYLAKTGEEVQVFTAMIVREDDVSLYGFSEKESLELFRKLMTVGGVGAKAAISVLSCMPVSELKKAIVFEDATALTKANGIGKKTAQRIVFELKDKIDSSSLSSEASVLLNEVSTQGDEKSEALAALVTLGYSKGEALSALATIKDEGLTTEEYVKKSLKKLF